MIRIFPKAPSLATRFLLLISFGFIIGFALLSFFSYHSLATTYDSHDRVHFTKKLNNIQNILSNTKINSIRKLKKEVIWEPREDGRVSFVKISDQNGQLIIETPGINTIIHGVNLSLVKKQSGNNPFILDKDEKRFLIWQRTLKANESTYQILIMINVTQDHKILNKFRREIIGISLILTLLFLLMGLILIQLGLSPLRFFVKKIKNLNPNTLEPVVLKGLPQELELLLSEINQLILRTKLSYENLSSFSANIAHELRTPLNNLMLSNEMFMLNHCHDDTAKNHMTSNIEEYQRLSTLIDKLLFIARLNANEKKATLDNIDLNDEICKVIEFHEALAQEKGINITTDTSGAILTDKDLFHNALSNVLTNAIKYSPPHTQIFIQTKSNGERMIISVADQGPGIPPAEFTNVTSRYHRLSNQYTTTTSGLGLGLSIVKSIMSSLDGSIDIKENKPNGVVVSLIFHA